MVSKRRVTRVSDTGFTSFDIYIRHEVFAARKHRGTWKLVRFLAARDLYTAGIPRNFVDRATHVREKLAGKICTSKLEKIIITQIVPFFFNFF